MGRKKYVVEGEVFSFCCDASERSFQLCKKFISTQQFSQNLVVREHDDQSYKVYDIERKEVLYVSPVKQIQ